MAVNSVAGYGRTNFGSSNVNNTNLKANYYEGLKKRRHQAVGLTTIGLSTLSLAYFCKNPYVSIATGIIGLLGSIFGCSSLLSTNKQIKEFEQGLNTMV